MLAEKLATISGDAFFNERENGRLEVGEGGPRREVQGRTEPLIEPKENLITTKKN